MARKQAHFRFYAELNDLLPPSRRFQNFTHDFELDASVKDTIESFGVPHTEVDMVVVNGQPVDFSYRVRHGDRISVYPVFESLDVSQSARLRPRTLREVRFVLDGHLGRLARHLRLLGFDTLYRREWADDELARIAAGQGRLLLTRDVGVLKRKEVTRGYFVRSTEPEEQLVEVLRRFDLARSVRPFERCTRCNVTLEAVAKEEVVDRLQVRTRAYHDDFRTCSSCGRVYWKGSHYERMRSFVDEIVRRAELREQA